MNSVILIGNLARDPELRYSTGMNQTAICRFTVAVNDGYGDKQRTSFIPIVVFGKQAENCDRYLAKGRKVAVNGRIQTGSYTNKDGNKVYTTDVIANNVEFLGGSNVDAGQGRQDFGQSQGGFGRSQQSAGGFMQSEPFPDEQPSDDPSQGIPEGFQKIQDDDIPF
ncbi:MAG: single-stranded DNA-binding protein [Firmicutes bacterium]|nr:single-stranded DNA-binding protein [Bacillota bacterium]